VSQFARVINAQLALGTSGHFAEEAVRLYFQALTQDTPIEGANLRLSWLPATYQCLSCQHRFESASSTETCPRCGDVVLEIFHQDACSVETIDVVSSDE
jgi:hydrogenase nickel incorporation protein HypA/HybF